MNKYQINPNLRKRKTCIVYIESLDKMYRITGKIF